ncbi:MAG: hypothetical protein Q7T03_03625 [Deltaproteobacteria bacterium]|nr:hypothetical protein [Deltaproteobacteria bacterium]
MDAHICKHCKKNLRAEIRIYDEDALYLDICAEGLPIKTENGAEIGCFYCFPSRRIQGGFLFVRNAFGVAAEEQKTKSVENNPKQVKNVSLTDEEKRI